MKQKFKLVYLFLILIIFQSCLEQEQTQIDVADMTIENVVVPNGFNYATTKDISVSLKVPEYLNGAVFSLVSYKAGTDSSKFARATFDKNGNFESVYTVSAFIDTILVNSEYLGLIDEIYIPITGGVADFDYRPLYDITNVSAVAEKSVMLKSATADGYTYLGSFNSNGVPSYLVANDVIEQNLLDDINASLPENSKVPQANPQFLSSGTETNIVLLKEADVWVTFVSEGAGYKNVLGYYTYKVGNAPATKEDIQSLNIIFPNVSFNGSGGGLYSGNKVKLGRFPGGTVVAWFLIANGFSNGQVTNGLRTVFSDSKFNPESNPAYQGHMVSLWDKSREQLLLGFEDLDRTPGSGSDEDFNDAVFYATANPVDAIKRDNVEAIIAANDSDGDGINDELDDFPYDPNKSFNNFAPSDNENGTVAYEDLWPSKGDYDFNDLVIDYKFNTIANASNLISSIQADFIVKHVGGSYKNGFAFILPVPSSTIQSVQNQVMNAGYASLQSNGTESGVSETVIFAFENAMPLVGDTISIVVNLSNSVSKSSLGTPPYNPFIVVDGERSREVHLPDLSPTSKGRIYLGTGDDYSDPNYNRYFKTERNLPWALNTYSTYTAPPERVSIDRVYPKFITWANSGGTKDLDWYR